MRICRRCLNRSARWRVTKRAKSRGYDTPDIRRGMFKHETYLMKRNGRNRTLARLTAKRKRIIWLVWPLKFNNETRFLIFRIIGDPTFQIFWSIHFPEKFAFYVIGKTLLSELYIIFHNVRRSLIVLSVISVVSVVSIVSEHRQM